jgi:bifunctional pyridoxal-dependent enzyme with beta-cystathionase and maltose regulon repressor activities
VSYLNMAQTIWRIGAQTMRLPFVMFSICNIIHLIVHPGDGRVIENPSPAYLQFVSTILNNCIIMMTIKIIKI